MLKTMTHPRLTSWKLLVTMIYIVAIISGIVCTTYTLAIVWLLRSYDLSLADPDNWIWVLPPFIPVFANVAYLILVIMVLAVRAWQKNMYKLYVWLPIFLGLLVMLSGNYLILLFFQWLHL